MILALPTTVFYFMLCVEAALGPSVPAHAQCEHSADLLGGPCGQQHQGQQPGQWGCHQPALRGRAGHTGACSWCAMVCLTREHMESGGCSRETAAPSAPNRPSGAAGVMMFEKPQLHPGKTDPSHVLRAKPHLSPSQLTF